MPTKEKKEILLKEIREKLSSAKSAVIADYRGLNVAEITKLRAKLRESGSELKVSKNTLTLIAARDLGLEGIDEYLVGPTAMAFGMEDLVAPAKIMNEFARTNKQLEIKGGIVEGRVIDAKGVKALADLPSREVLLARVLGGMQTPMYGFASVLQGNLRNLVYVLNAIQEKKAAEGTA